MGKGPKPKPEFAPDLIPGPVYEAVGYALSAWEGIEAQLSLLYSIFIRQPGAIQPMQEYGKRAPMFEARMQAIERAGLSFFTTHCSQTIEGELCRIISETRRSSKLRHQIAHGIVNGFLASTDNNADGMAHPTPSFWLIPPLYAVFNLTKHDDEYYRLNSRSIFACALEFNNLAEEIKRFCNTTRALLPP